MSTADQSTPTVFLVDDDDALREALCQLLEGAGWHVESYADGATFLVDYRDERPGCLLLDVAMPGLSGLAVQHALQQRGLAIPIVFLTGHGDIPMAVAALQAGAMDFLEKPVAGGALLERVRRALELDREQRASQAEVGEVRRRYARLSAREREVLALVRHGLSSKEIALKLGLSHRTVEAHRIHIMHKMGARSLAELINRAALVAT
jgi:FixJ family two-component response regulator